MGEKLNFVRKRDGRVVSFDTEKIANAIFKAAQSIGGQDKYLAEDLAEAVKLYLIKESKKDIPSVEDIQDVVERVLIKTGHAKTAKAYILYREKRARIRRIREGIQPGDVDLTEVERQNLIKNINLSVRESNDNISLWDKERIINALTVETGLSRNISELIVGEIEEEILTSKVNEISSSLIRELVNSKLITYGFEKERNLHTRLGVPVYDVNNFLRESPDTPDDISLQLGRHIKKEFALLQIFSENISEKHLTGEIRINNLEGIDKFYSILIPIEKVDMFSEKEVMDFIYRLKMFTEKEVILSIPRGYKKKFTIPEISNLSIEAGVDIVDSNTKSPFFLRIDKEADFAHLNNLYAKIKALDIIKGDIKKRVVLNRMTFDVSWLKDTPNFSESIRNSLTLCNEIMKRQESFMEKIYLKRELPEIFKVSNKTIEIELVGCNYLTAPQIKSLCNEILSFSPSFSLKVLCQEREFSEMKENISLLTSFIEDGFQIRFEYV